MTKEAGKPERVSVQQFLAKWQDGSISQQRAYRSITHSGTTQYCLQFAECFAEAYARSGDGAPPTIAWLVECKPKDDSDTWKWLAHPYKSELHARKQMGGNPAYEYRLIRLAGSDSPEQGKPPQFPDTSFSFEERTQVLRYLAMNAQGGNWPIDWNAPIVKAVLEKIQPRTPISVDDGWASSQGATSEPKCICGHDYWDHRKPTIIDDGPCQVRGCKCEAWCAAEGAPEPPSQPVCPKCHGEILSGAHGSYCPKPTCKWGWDLAEDLLAKYGLVAQDVNEKLSKAAAKFPQDELRPNLGVAQEKAERK